MAGTVTILTEMFRLRTQLVCVRYLTIQSLTNKETLEILCILAYEIKRSKTTNIIPSD